MKIQPSIPYKLTLPEHHNNMCITRARGRANTLKTAARRHIISQSFPSCFQPDALNRTRPRRMQRENQPALCSLNHSSRCFREKLNHPVTDDKYAWHCSRLMYTREDRGNSNWSEVHLPIQCTWGHPFSVCSSSPWFNVMLCWLCRIAGRHVDGLQ